MAEKLCSLKKSGGKMSETVLWTNSAPTSNFEAQNVTLSKSINDYKYIKIVWRFSTTNTATTSLLIPVSDIGSLGPYANDSLLMFGSVPGSYYARAVYKVSNTSMNIGGAYALNTAGLSNNLAIPYQIIGLK